MEQSEPTAVADRCRKQRCSSQGKRSGLVPRKHFCLENRLKAVKATQSTFSEDACCMLKASTVKMTCLVFQEEEALITDNA